MQKVDRWEQARAVWETLPVLVRGESKDIRIVDNAHVMVRLISSLYSFTRNRSAIIEGTGAARLEAWRCLSDVLRSAGLKVAPVAFGADYCVTKRMKVDGEDYVPPIEVVVKARHIGTPKHTLYQAERHRAPLGARLIPDQAHVPYIRFDYTNPLTDAEGKRLRDECIPRGLAQRYMDTATAEPVALAAFCSLYGFLSARGIRLDDICFKLDHSGQILFGELSQDCMRAVWVGEDADFFGGKGVDASKDTFRAGSSPEIVAERYDRFVELLRTPPIREPVSPFDAEQLGDA